MLTSRDTSILHKLLEMLNDRAQYSKMINDLLTRQQGINDALAELEVKKRDIDQKIATFQSVVEQVAADKKQVHMLTQSHEKVLINIQNGNVELKKREDKLEHKARVLLDQERSLNMQRGKLFDAEADVVRRESVLADQERMMQSKIAQLNETETALTNRMEKLRTFVAAPV